MLRTLACCAVVLLATRLNGNAAGAYPDNGSAADAKELVDAAVAAELTGDDARRKSLLDNAMAADADYGLARWHSGQVHFDGKWRTPEDVAELVTEDRRWKGYRELRDAAAGTLEDHIALAQYCLKHGLTDEERYHWSSVILADPANLLARQRLGVREYRGGLFTKAQVEEHERQLKQAEANLKKYKPQFVKLVRDARGNSRSAREAALAKVRAIGDIGAIPALELAMGRSKRAEADERTKALHLALVAALAAMREHEATLYLMNYSLFSESKEVRKLAAEGLRSRPTTDYVPLLMGALTAPIEVEFDVVTAPDGTVRMVETLHQSGPEADANHTQTTNFEVAGVEGRDRTKVDPSAVLVTHLNRARAQAEQTQARISSFNEAAEQRNARIQETIKIATGMDAGADPEQYWASWKTKNELYYDDEPVYDTYDEETYTYSYEQAPRYVAGSPARARIARSPSSHSCFAPGTLVWTQAGPRPIEQIGVGELVLAQHPTTGELSYRPVLQTTYGDPVPVMHVAIAGETITATYGHRFWVNGRGWQMAKELTPASSLHALNRGLDVTGVSKGDDMACHNLVVEDFHTFFVGKSRVLVHDKSCPAPTLSTIPGSMATAVSVRHGSQ